MQFLEIRYVERDTVYGQKFVLSMPGGYGVQKGTVQDAWKQVHLNWPNIDWSVKQCAETLIGGEYWKPMKIGKQLAMGRCIKFFIAHDMLPKPLKVANPGKKGKRFCMPK